MKNILDKITKYCLYLLVFLLPIFFLPFTAEAYEFNKQFLLFFLVSLAFFAWLLKMVAFDKEIRFRRTALDIPVLIFMLVMILSAVFSVDKPASVLGFYGRFSDSLVGVLSLGMMYFLITNRGNWGDKGNRVDLGDRGDLARVFLGSAGVVMLMSYFSLFGIWVRINSYLSLISDNLSFISNLSLPSVMLQKTFNPVAGSMEGLVVFLAVVIVMIVGTVLNPKSEIRNPKQIQNSKSEIQNKLQSFFYGLLLVAALGLLMIIDFIIAWIVLGLSLTIFLAFALWSRVFKQKINVLLLPIFLVVISLVFIFINTAELTQNLNAKLTQNLPQEVLLNQAVSWDIGWQSLKARPILGSGPGTFSHNFSKFRPAEFNQSNYWQVRFDRAGSHIAESVATTGVLGILTYLMVIGVFLWAVNPKSQIRNPKQIPNPKSQIQKNYSPLLFVLVALVIAQFVYYQNTVLMFMFWLVLALSATKLTEMKISFKDFPELNLIFNVVLIIVGIGVLGMYYFAAQFYLADRAYAKGREIENLEKAVKLNPYQPSYRIVLSQLYLQEVLSEIDKPADKQDFAKIQNNTAQAIQEAKLANTFSPNWVKTQEILGMVYRDIQGIAAGAQQWAKDSFEKAIFLEPTNPVLYTELGKLLLAEGKNQEARKEFEKAIELKPDYVEAIFQRGLIYFNEGEVDEAISKFEKAIKLNPRHSNSLYSLGVAYQRRGKDKEALEMFERVLELNPGNEDVQEKIQELK